MQNAVGGILKLYDQHEYKNCAAHPSRWQGQWQQQIISNANIPSLVSKIIQMIKMKNNQVGAAGDGVDIDTYSYAPDANQLTVANVRLVFAKTFSIPVPTHAIRIQDSEKKGTHEFQWVFDNELPKKANVELYSGDYSTLIPVIKSRSFMCDEKGQPLVDLVYSDLKWGVFERIEDDAPDDAVKVGWMKSVA